MLACHRAKLELTLTFLCLRQTVAPGEHVGVGVGFDKLETGLFQISALFPGASADLSGDVYVGDRLVEVDDEPVFGRQVVSTCSFSLSGFCRYPSIHLPFYARPAFPSFTNS
jgi:hypothetical protein